MRWSEITAWSPSSGAQAGLLEALGPLRITHLTPAAFSPAPGDPHFPYPPPGLRGAPAVFMPCFSDERRCRKAEGVQVCMWGTPDTRLNLREHPAGARCVWWPLAPSQWHPPPASHSRLTALFTLQGEHEAGRPTPGSWVSLMEKWKEGVWYGSG